MRQDKPIPKTTYGKPQYNKVVGDHQRIELSRGCPNGCSYCYEPFIKSLQEVKVFPIPEIKCNYVEILDMNFLFQPNILKRIEDLPYSFGKYNNVITYEEICGFDFRLMTQEIANKLKSKRFIKIRIAWDRELKDQYKIKDTLKMLEKARFRSKTISVFILVNWEISYEDCLKKLDLLKVWKVKVNDCCFNGGYKNAIPKDWKAEQLKDFRSKCRKHNQLVNFEIDPELKSN